jgi:RHS repeat-associated protein
MTDASAALAWSVAYEPFGAVASVNAVSSAIDLRFPGQWFQLENGLHYNWHRHYDATLGRYLQPDPNGNEFVSSAIGSDINLDPAQTTPASTLTPFLLEYTPAIRNGLPQPSLRVQPYSYARSTPLSAIDPSGLQAQVVIGRCLRFPQLCAAPIAAAVAAGVNACLRTMAGSSGGGGGGDDYQRCMRAANGNENDWASFCRTIRRGIPNNVVGEGTARAACFNHTLESTQNKINWCENQFGRH